MAVKTSKSRQGNASAVGRSSRSYDDFFSGKSEDTIDSWLYQEKEGEIKIAREGTT